MTRRVLPLAAHSMPALHQIVFAKINHKHTIFGKTIRWKAKSRYASGLDQNICIDAPSLNCGKRNVSTYLGWIRTFMPKCQVLAAACAPYGGILHLTTSDCEELTRAGEIKIYLYWASLTSCTHSEVAMTSTPKTFDAFVPSNFLELFDLAKIGPDYISFDALRAVRWMTLM
jgi:hypothetical protein